MHMTNATTVQRIYLPLPKFTYSNKFNNLEIRKGKQKTKKKGHNPSTSESNMVLH